MKHFTRIALLLAALVLALPSSAQLIGSTQPNRVAAVALPTCTETVPASYLVVDPVDANDCTVGTGVVADDVNLCACQPDHTGGARWTSIASSFGVQPNSVDSGAIIDGEVSTADIGNSQITTLKILDRTIQAGDIALGGIGSAELTDGGVLLEDLASTNSPSLGLCLTASASDTLTYAPCGTATAETLVTAETDTALVLKPDGAGGTVWGAESGGGSGATSEAELEDDLADVGDVFTDNDGALDDDDLSDNSTSDLAEGSNLYYTEGRVDARIGAVGFSPDTDPSVDHSGYVAGHGDGTDCPSGQYARGVDGSGNATGCTADVSGSGSTDITVTPAPTSVAIDSSSGADDILPAATTVNAGAMTGADKTKLDGIEANAAADQTDAEILSAWESETGRTVATDAAKLDGIENAATADQTAAEVSFDNTITSFVASQVQAAIDEMYGYFQYFVEGKYPAVIYDSGSATGGIMEAAAACAADLGGVIVLPPRQTVIDVDGMTSPVINLPEVDRGDGFLVGSCALEGLGSGAESAGSLGAAPTSLRFNNVQDMVATDGRKTAIRARAQGQRIAGMQITLSQPDSQARGIWASADVRNEICVAANAPAGCCTGLGTGTCGDDSDGSTGLDFLQIEDVKIRDSAATDVAVGIEVQGCEKGKIDKANVEQMDTGLLYALSPTNEECTGAGTPWSCCTGSATGDCNPDARTNALVVTASRFAANNIGIDVETERAAGDMFWYGNVIEGNVEYGIRFQADSEAFLYDSGNHWENADGIVDSASIKILSDDVTLVSVGSLIGGTSDHAIHRTVGQISTNLPDVIAFSDIGRPVTYDAGHVRLFNPIEGRDDALRDYVGNVYGNNIKWHATDCTTPTGAIDGFKGDVCWELGSGDKYVCNPSTAGDNTCENATGWERWEKTPSASTDHAISRFDGTGGDLQGSGVTIDDSDNLTVPGTLSTGGSGNPTCIVMRDSDDGGDSACEVLNGTFSCETDTNGTCGDAT